MFDKSECGLHVGVLLLEQPDGLDGLDAVLAGLLLPGADGEGQGVDQDRRLVDAPVAGDVGDQPLGDLDLLLGGAGLALLVDGQRDHGGAVLGDQLHGLVESRLRAVAVLVVHRVDRAPAAEVLQTRLQHRGFGGVQHDRQRRRGGQPAGQRVHVGDAVAADVVDAQVEQVGAVARLVLGDVEALLPVLGEHRLAERLGAVGVRPLADHQHRCVLGERHRRVQRRHRGLVGDVRSRALHTGDGLGDLADVFGCGAAAAADQRQPVLGDEARQRLGEFVGLQRVFGAVGAQHRQTRRWASPTRACARAGTGSAGARSSRRARWRSSARSCRRRAARPPSARRRSRCPAAWCRWFRP